MRRRTLKKRAPEARGLLPDEIEQARALTGAEADAYALGMAHGRRAAARTVARRRARARGNAPTGPTNAAGVPVGSPRIGERVLANGERDPDPRVLADLVRIKDLREGSDPLTFEAVAAVLNAEGRTTQRGARWTIANVQYAYRRAIVRGLYDGNGAR